MIIIIVIIVIIINDLNQHLPSNK